MWYLRIGSRVTGPFTQEQLASMRKLGEFGPTHHISTDGVKWQSAAQLVNAIDGPSPNWIPRKPEPVQSPLSDSGSGTSPAVAKREWYYIDAQRQQQGPVPEQNVRDLLLARQLNARTQACKVGDTQWAPIAQHPELKSYVPQGSGRVATIAMSSVAGVAVLGLLVVFVLPRLTGAGGTAGGSGKPGGLLNVMGGGNSLLIKSPNEREKIASAVGLVMGTYRPQKPDGSPGPKLQSGTGTAFAITADGYLLTNEHVAEMANPDVKKEEFINDLKGMIADLLEDFKKIRQGPATPQTLQAVAKIKAQIDGFDAWIKHIEKKSTDIEAKLVVFFGGVPFDAKLVYESSRYDMAILKVDRKVDRPYFPISANSEVDQGKVLYVFGYPGITKDKGRSASNDAVREHLDRPGADPIKSLLATDFEYSRSEGPVTRCVADSAGIWSMEHQAVTFQGNSGGPAILDNGVVVGIHSMGITDKRGGAKLNVAHSLGQFRKEIDAYVLQGVTWVGK